MKALVVYDSMFGNTAQVAQAMATALADQMDATARRVSEVTPEELTAVDFLIVGSPTQGFRPTPATNALLDSISAQGLLGVQVAAFDTRIDVAEVGNWFLTFMVKIFGYAAKPIANRLEKKGGELVMAPEGFVVNGKEGPLKAGELERAATWAKLGLLVTT
jgi:flavodoxin